MRTIKNKTTAALLGLSVLTGAVIASAAPDNDEDAPKLPFESEDVTEEEKWSIEYVGPEYDVTLADVLDGKSIDPKMKLDGFTARIRADLDLSHQGSYTVVEDLDAHEGEADEMSEHEEALQLLLDTLILFLKIFGLLEESASDYALNGIYDGLVWSENGSSTDAVIKFTQHQGDIFGTLVFTDADMTLDAGCAVVEMPVSSYSFDASRVSASPGNIVEAEAYVQRQLRVQWLFGTHDVDVDVGMWFGLHDDFDSLEAQFEIDPSSPCSDTLASGYFIRRPGTSPLP